MVLVLFSSSVMADQGGTKKVGPPFSSASKSEDAPSADEEIHEGPSENSQARIAAVSSIEPEKLDGFDHYAPQIQQLIRDALALTKLNLTYTFGSSNPKQGGMDCSGTIFHLLNALGLKSVPRQSNEMCAWVQSHTLLHRIDKADSLKHPEFAALHPGDLLFWSGTYEATPRTLPVTHVMLYLGKMKTSGRHLLFGASDGRAYQGERRTGVSVFDFSIPREGSKSKLYGYGLIPGVGRIIHKTPELRIIEAPTKPATAETVTVTSAPKGSPPVSEETVKKAIIPTEAPAASQPTNKTPAPGKATNKPTAKTKSAKTGSQTRPKSSQPSGSTNKSKSTPRTTPASATVQEQIRQTASELGGKIRALISP